jgi:DUF1365 family protein
LSTVQAPIAPPAQALVGRGQVRHRRLRPRAHAFSYPTYFLMLPLRQLRSQPAADLPRNRWGLISFSDSDHGDGRADCLQWLEELLHQEGIDDALGEVWLHCYPRVLGYTFKPVSFWYCHRTDNSLAAIVVEVNNTFGEKHCYLLQGSQLGWGKECTANKVFHVSPFCEVTGTYRFRFMRSSNQRTVVRIDHDDELGPLIQTSVSGQLQPLTRRSLLAAFVGMPLMTWGVIARIHWQAMKLWAKRIPFVNKPPAPDVFVTR